MHEDHEFPYETAFIRKLLLLSNYATKYISSSPSKFKSLMTKMEKLQGVYIGHNPIILLLCLFIFIGCKKTSDHPAECGCINWNIKGHMTYNDYEGKNYYASLNYLTGSQSNAWYISVHILDTSYALLCKICNADLRAVRAFTDTSSKDIPIPVKIVGTVRGLCESEDWGFRVYPGTVKAYISIDSMIAQ